MVGCIRKAIRLSMPLWLLAFAGCQNIDPGIFDDKGFNEVTGMDLSPRTTKGGGAGGSTFGKGGGTPGAQIFYGSQATGGTGGGGSGNSGAANTGDGVSLDFTDAPIQTVAQAVIGDILHEAFVIDPRVQGTLTLSSGRPVPRAAILPVLEAALRMNNAVLVRDPTLYKIIPASDAAGAGGTEWVRGQGQPTAGYGISVLPLQYASSQAVMRLVEGFGARPGSIRVDAANNLLLIAGTAQERQSAISTAQAFDVDWMRNQSAGIFPVSNGTPEVIIREINTLMNSGSGGASMSEVRLQPIERMNAILAVARRPQTINEVDKWISRLDRADYGASRIHIYNVRFGRAVALAAILNNSFAGGGGGAGGIDQLAPGAVAAGGQSAGAGAGGAAGAGGGQMSGDQGGDAGKQPDSSGAQTADQGGEQGGASFGSSAIGSTDGNSNDAGFGGGGGGGGDQSGGSGGTNSGAFQGVRITPDPAANAIVIYANADQYRIIERALIELDRQPLQVAIEATIAEITLNDKLKYGVQYFLKTSINGTTINMAQFGAATALNQVAPAFNLILGSESGSRVILDLLRTVTRVKVVSTPSLVVVNNEAAALQVGDQVPVTTRTATSVDSPDAPTVNQIEFKNTGVILNVRPRISANNMVNIDVEQEISAVVNNSNAETLTPTISQRRVRSQISVPSGQTVMLAGLISDREEGTRSGIPGLMNMPVIGKLVSSTGILKDRTELIVFIKPQIIRDAQDASDIAKGMRGRMFNGNTDN